MNKKLTQLGEIEHQTQNLKKKKVNLKTSLVANKQHWYQCSSTVNIA